MELKNEELVKKLLEKNINHLIRYKEGCNVFHMVAQYGNFEMFKQILEKFMTSKELVFCNIVICILKSN